MNTFINKKIVSFQTMPEALRIAREQLKENITDIAKKINVQEKYLEMLEDGFYDQLPGEIYAKQWIKQYGQYLNLDTKWLIKEYCHEKGVQMQFNGLKQQPKKEIQWLAWLTPRFIKFAALSIATLALITYLGIGIKNILEPPALVIYEPQNNIVITDKNINIKGQTDAEIEITINNEIILADEQGYFNKQINLSPGLNILEIIAAKKHGSKNSATISIYREVNQAATQNGDLSKK